MCGAFVVATIDTRHWLIDIISMNLIQSAKLPSISVALNKKNSRIALIDTGASASFISQDCIPEEIKLIPSYNGNIRDLTGTIDSIGHIYCNLNITKNVNVHIKLIVISNQHKMPRDIILGTDFLSRCAGEVNFKENIQQDSYKATKIFKNFIEFNNVDNNVNFMKVSENVEFKINKNLKIPPRSHFIFESNSSHVEGSCCISKNFSPDKMIMVAETLVDIKNKSAPILLMNTSDKSIMIKAGSVVAKGEMIEPQNFSEMDECAFTIFKNNSNNECTSDSNKVDDISMADINELVDAQHAKELLPLLNKYRNVLAKKGEPLGKTKILKAEIDTGDHSPIYTKQYQMPHSTKEAARKLIEDMLQQKVISHSKSPWNSPLILVKKKDGTFRPCIDFRKLNAITLPDIYPLSNIGDLLRNLRGAKFFSTLDLQSSFWQTELEEKDKLKTAFTTDEGHFHFEVLPFGLKNAGSIFQRLMNISLAGLIGTAALIYIDDIIIFSNTVEDHLNKLDKLFSKLRDANLKVKLSKCAFLKDKIKFLGHEVSSEGIKIHNDHFLPLKNFPTPTTRKGVQKFLGSASYFRTFIKIFSGIMEPITKLLRKEEKFVWGGPQKEAFQRIKDEICSAPTLNFPNFQRKFYLTTDASGDGLGAALMQEHNDQFVPIYFLSRGLTKSEKNYSTTKREALAIVWALQKLKHIIWGYKVELLTDHKPLEIMFSKSIPEGQIGRWALCIQEFDLSIRYIKGKDNVLADALSRLDTHTIPNEDGPINDDNMLVDFVGSVNIEDDWTTDELIDAQKSDKAVNNIRNVVLAGENDEGSIQVLDINKYFIYDDILFYRKSIEKLGGREDCVNVVIPSHWEEKIIKLAHESAANNHMATERTLFKRNL